jgi:(2Fe-2S) ferredoxin
MATFRVYVCQGDSCKRRGAQAVWQALRREVYSQAAEEAGDLIVGGCQGRCDYGPNLIIHPGATKYSGTTPQDVPAIVREHLLGGKIVEELRFGGW